MRQGAKIARVRSLRAEAPMSKTRKGHVVIEDITDPVLRRYAEEKLLAEQLSENSVSSYLSDLLFFAD